MFKNDYRSAVAWFLFWNGGQFGVDIATLHDALVLASALRGRRPEAQGVAVVLEKLPSGGNLVLATEAGRLWDPVNGEEVDCRIKCIIKKRRLLRDRIISAMWNRRSQILSPYRKDRGPLSIVDDEEVKSPVGGYLGAAIKVLETMRWPFAQRQLELGAGDNYN